MIRNVAALEAMRESVFVAEVATGIIVDANPAAVALCGRSLAELRALHHSELLAPENVERPQSGFLSAPQNPGSIEGTVLHKDGHRIPVEITSSHFIGPDGKRMLIAIFRDITERKPAGEGLHRIEETFWHVRKLVAKDVLRQSEFIQAALDNISDGVAACDSAGDLVLFNRAARKWHGTDAFKLPRDQWSSYYDLFGPDGITPLDKESVPLRRAFCGEHFHDVDLTIAAKGQPLRHIQASGGPFYDNEGQKLGGVVAFHDVTERKQAEQALRESEERFRSTFEQAAVGIAHVGPDGRFLRINRRFCQITGYSQEQMLERTFQEITHPDDIDIDLEHKERLLRGEIETYSMDKRYIRKEGSPVWANKTVSLVRNNAGDPAWFVFVIQDITERKQAETALRESEERFRNMADTAPVMIWVSGPDNLGTFFNKAWLDFTGRTLEDELGDGWAKGVHRDDLDHCLATCGGSFEACRAFQVEFRLRRADGEYRWILDTGVPRYRGGEFIGFIGSCVDVTEQKLIEERLRASEARLLGAQRLANVGSWERQVETGEIRWSDEMFRIYGVNEAPPNVSALLRYVHPRDREKLLAGDPEVLSGKAPVDMEYRIIRPDGEIRFVRAILQAIRNDQDVPVRIVGATQDITELVKTRESLRESEDRLKEAERIAHVGHWQLDIKRNVASWSGETFRIFGKRRDYIPSYEGFLQALIPLDRERVDRAIRNCVSAKRGGSIEYQISRPNGDLRTVVDTFEVLLDEEGLPVQLFGTSQDITELKRAQKRDFERQKLETVGTLAGGIAHDFNNLLGGVLSQAELALAEIAEGSYPVEQLRVIQGLAIRGSDIVRELMIYAGQESAVAGPVDVSSVVEEMLGLVKVSVSKHAKLEVDLDRNLPAVWGNTAQLVQIVMNLVTNASEAIGAQDGMIHVATTRVTIGGDVTAIAERVGEGDYVQLEVSDTGVGMSVETQAKVFDPFFTMKSGGHGLGLAVVHGIVRSLGGTIHVASAPGKGTTFRVLLPCDSVPCVTAPSTVSTPVQLGPPSQEATILVVEDEDALRQPVARLLRSTGFSVLEASDGSAALDVIREHNTGIEFLLLDVTLPGASSHAVLEEATRLRPKMKVIVTSAYSKDAAAASLQANVVHFLRKPYKVGDLVDMVRRTM